MIDLSRRNLMLGAAIGAASTGAPALAQPASLRDRFNLAPGLLYFNAANIGIGFRAAAAAERAAAASEQSDPSFENRAQFTAVATALRPRIAAQIKAPVESISLTRNCSEGNIVVVRGLKLKAGDEVVIGRENHECNRNGWKARAAREGIVVRVADYPALPASPQEVIDAFAAQVGPRTRVIAVSHVSNVAGLIMPAAELASMARAHGAWFHLDGAQSYGWMQIDVAALGCDSYAGATQKWLMGPIGGGMLYVKPERIAELDPPVLSHGYWNSGPPGAVTGQAFEQLGQSDDAKLVNYAATLDARALIGEAPIETMTRERAASLRRRLDAKGVKVGGSGDPALWGPVLAVEISGDVAARRAALWKEHRVAASGARSGAKAAVRISPHIYNSDADLDRLATLLA